MGLLLENFVLDLGTLAVCVLTGIYIYCKVSFNYWQKRNVPFIKPTFPFGNFGDMLFLRACIGHLFEKIYKKLDGEKYGGTYAFAKPGFVFRDPDIIKNVLVKDFSSFHDRGFFMDE
jgi:cytochrome P450 family 6